METKFQKPSTENVVRDIRRKTRRLYPQYLTKKQSVFQKLVSFVEKFKGV